VGHLLSWQGKTVMNYKKRMAILCLVFGCRLSEVRLSWDEWDFDKWLWTVPKEHGKNGEIIRPFLKNASVARKSAKRLKVWLHTWRIQI
jgi:integrase